MPFARSASEVAEGVVHLQRRHHVLGLGPGQQQGDVAGLERGAGGLLRGRDDGVLVDRGDPHERVDPGGQQGAAARGGGRGEQERGVG